MWLKFVSHLSAHREWSSFWHITFLCFSMYFVVFQLLLIRSVIRYFRVSLALIIVISSLFIVLLFLLFQIAHVVSAIKRDFWVLLGVLVFSFLLTLYSGSPGHMPHQAMCHWYLRLSRGHILYILCYIVLVESLVQERSRSALCGQWEVPETMRHATF